MLFSIGQTTPDFTALTTGDKTIQLADFKGRYLLLYFYPRDNTPGCTQEGLDFKAAFAEFTALNCALLGISRDSMKTHENFKAKHAFPFDLISDHDEALCQMFDVIKMKTMYGKQARGIERSSFLINPDGVLIHEWRRVKVKTHIQEVLAQLQQLK
jgi:peroxiredoxin Q/BCP